MVHRRKAPQPGDKVELDTSLLFALLFPPLRSHLSVARLGPRVPHAVARLLQLDHRELRPREPHVRAPRAQSCSALPETCVVRTGTQSSGTTVTRRASRRAGPTRRLFTSCPHLLSTPPVHTFCSQVSWSDLALDVPPEADDVGLDSTVLFWHGVNIHSDLRLSVNRGVMQRSDSTVLFRHGTGRPPRTHTSHLSSHPRPQLSSSASLHPHPSTANHTHTCFHQASTA